MKGGNGGSKEKGGEKEDNVYALDFQSTFFPVRKFRFKGVLLAGRSEGFFLPHTVITSDTKSLWGLAKTVCTR